MRRAALKPLRPIPAAAILLLWNLFAFSPCAIAAPPGKDRARERDAVNLGEMVIRGNSDYPGVLYRLPPPEAPPLPFTAGPDERAESLLHDTRDEDDASPSSGR